MIIDIKQINIDNLTDEEIEIMSLNNVPIKLSKEEMIIWMDAYIKGAIMIRDKDYLKPFKK